MIISKDIGLGKNSKCYSDHLNFQIITTLSVTVSVIVFQSVRLLFDAFVKKQMSAPLQ